MLEYLINLKCGRETLTKIKKIKVPWRFPPDDLQNSIAYFLTYHAELLDMKIGQEESKYMYIFSKYIN